MTATVPVVPNSAVRSVVSKRGSFAARRQQLLPHVAAVTALHCTLDMLAEKACWAVLESEARLRKHVSRHLSVHKKSHSLRVHWANTACLTVHLHTATGSSADE